MTSSNSSGKESFVLFLRENKRYYVSEDDCKFIVKYYDSDNDGCMNYIE